MGDPKNFVDVEVEHLCGVCQYTHKCIRFKGITEALHKVEESALDKWRVDLEITYGIKKCEMFSIDDKKMMDMLKEIMEEIDEEANESFGFRNRLLDEGDDF